MPAPIPDASRDQQCHHYQAPTGMRCGSPAMRSEYYCYHHKVRSDRRASHRVLIDPEVTRMDIPVLEDRASIFVAMAAVIHRLADNTIDTSRSGQMLYGLQAMLRALPAEPKPAPRAECCHHENKSRHPGSTKCRHSQQSAEPAAEELRETASATTSDTTWPPDPAIPKTINITKQSLLYFLRSRHCAHCNAELFPPEELTERRNPGAPPEIIEEYRPSLPAPAAAILPGLQAVASPVTRPGFIRAASYRARAAKLSPWDPPKFVRTVVLTRPGPPLASTLEVTRFRASGK